MNQEKLREEYNQFIIHECDPVSLLGARIEETFDWWFKKLQEHNQELWQKMQDMKSNYTSEQVFSFNSPAQEVIKILTAIGARESISQAQSLLALDEEKNETK